MANKVFTRDWTPEEVRQVLDVTGGDGHSIFYASAFPVRVQERFAQTIKSNVRDFKETIFGPDGKVIPVAENSIYGLDVLQGIAGDLRVEYRSAYGRGSRARNITAALLVWLKAQGVQA
jgi:hypothetical protein